MITNETLKIIRQRRSTRSYRDEQIRDDELQAVLEAGLYAPYGGGQAWHFTAVQSRGLLDRLNLAAKEVARQMGVEHFRKLGSNEQYNCLYGAPTLIIVSAPEQYRVPLDADCAAATENILLAAESLGLGSCWIFFVLLAFRSPQTAELRRELQLPEGYKPYSSAVIGYKGAATPEAPERKPNLVTIIK